MQKNSNELLLLPNEQSILGIEQRKILIAKGEKENNK
jgi:hypothetical protein